MPAKKHTSLKLILASGLLAAVGCADVEVEQTTAAAGPSSQRVIVKYKNATGRSAALAGAATVHHDLANHGLVAATMPAAAINGLSHNPNIEYVEEDVKRYPMAEVTPYGIDMTQADDPTLTYDANGSRTLCIIDSGYDLGHEDLPTTNVTGSGDWTNDTCGHGTHVAGTIAARGGNGKGVVGVNPNSDLNLYIVRVFGGGSPGDCAWSYSSGLVAALDECVANGANVVSMSLGGGMKSRSEERAFANANSAGVLSIAAAGNDGNTRKSYPASYDSVMSVAAIDENKNIADFSQQNDQVEIAAPGVGVLSTVPMGTASISGVTVGSTTYVSAGMEGSADGTSTGALVDCGLGKDVCSAAAGNICLIARGDIAFADKADNCIAGGGIGAIIYNNVEGLLSNVTLGGDKPIVVVGVSDTDGAALLGQLGATATVSNASGGGNYDAWNGTSMATPHVSGVAALVWSRHADCTNDEIRSALNGTAEDLGAGGRDNVFGYGLVQAQAADGYLTANGCGGGGGGGGGGGSVCGDGTCNSDEDAASCPADCDGGGSCSLGQVGDFCSADSDCCSNSCKGKPGNKSCK